MNDNRNMILAIVLSLGILFGFQGLMGYLYPTAPEQATQTPAPKADLQQPPPSAAGAPGVPSAMPDQGGGMAPTAPGAQPAPPPSLDKAMTRPRQAVLAEVPRVRIETPRVHGSISLVGGRLDDITLADYRETLDPHSPEIVLFSPPKTANAYYAETGWIAGGAAPPLPTPDTLWKADADVLTPTTPVTLTWDNGAGLLFKRTFSIDENYLVTVSQSVVNNGTEPVTLFPYALVSRKGTPQGKSFFILHEGPLGVFDGTLNEQSYADLRDHKTISEKTTGGWIGITDKYWLAALIPGKNQPVDARYVYQDIDKADHYQVDMVGGGHTVAPGEEISQTWRLFAGAKEVHLLDKYQEEYGIDRFDLAIDFGWFYFLTKPFFLLLIWLRGIVGNLGVAILLFTVIIKALFYPLADRSYKAMSKMRALQPEMTKIRERFADDRPRQQQEMMALYKREKVNPAAGCLPILIQIPVFFALYKVLFVTIEMRHAPFFGWIQDLSAPDPTNVFNLFGLIPWDPPQFLMIGVWPLLMGITMFLQQKLNPQPPDPIQAKIFMVLPVVFTVMLAHFPAGLVIYWTWNNLLSILQQWLIMRRMGVKV